MLVGGLLLIPGAGYRLATLIGGGDPTASVLAELGLSSEEVAELARRGVVNDPDGG